jgi:hypothetical protein
LTIQDEIKSIGSDEKAMSGVENSLPSKIPHTESNFSSGSNNWLKEQGKDERTKDKRTKGRKD